MADCKKYREMISCYADGELSGNNKNELLRHLEECTSCRSLLSVYTRITAAVEEALVEPPENLTSQVMNKIKMLSENEQKQITTVRKQNKKIRPLIISFASVAACLALVFVLSPQLFGFEKSTIMSSIPMVSAPINYGMASEEAAPHNDMQDTGLKTAGNPEESSSAEDGAGTAADTVTPEPATDQVPNFAMSGRGDSDALKEYYAIFEIEGQLPTILEGFSMTDNEDGTFNIEITAETAEQLIEGGFATDVVAPEISIALVKYTPESTT